MVSPALVGGETPIFVESALERVYAGSKTRLLVGRDFSALVLTRQRCRTLGMSISSVALEVVRVKMHNGCDVVTLHINDLIGGQYSRSSKLVLNRSDADVFTPTSFFTD